MCFTVDEINRRDGIQDEVNEAAFDQNWIVYGPAGTGKTIIALARLQRLCRLLPNEEHVLISKSKLLNRWVELSAGRMGLGNNVDTFDRYVWHKVASYLNGWPDKVDKSESWSEIDWDLTIPRLRRAFTDNPDMRRFSLILDEAQDVRPGFFHACNIICSRVFILMDENQKTEVFANTKRDFIASTLGIDDRHQKYLGINYRNPEAIKSLSEVFFDGDESELAELAPEDVRPVLEAPPTIRFLPFKDETVQIDQVRHVLGYCRDRPQSTVCVVAPTPQHVRPIAAALREGCQNFPILKNVESWRVLEYIPETGVPCELNLCAPGIVVSTALNVKGSEYSAVFLTQWEDSRDKNPAMYTVVTRAKTRLEVLSSESDEAKSTIGAQFRAALDSGLISEA
jgi:DNA helicase IV